MIDSVPDSAPGTAGNRRVDECRACLVQPPAQFALGRGANRAHIDQQLASRCAGQQTVWRQHHFFKLSIGGDNRDRDLGGLHHFGRRGHPASPQVHELIDNVGPAGVKHQRVAGPQQVLGHRPPHGSQANEADRRHGR